MKKRMTFHVPLRLNTADKRSLGGNKAKFAAEAGEAKTIYETALRQVETFEQLAQVTDRLSQ